MIARRSRCLWGSRLFKALNSIPEEVKHVIDSLIEEEPRTRTAKAHDQRQALAIQNGNLGDA
jgi:hypothetical protein